MSQSETPLHCKLCVLLVNSVWVKTKYSLIFCCGLFLSPVNNVERDIETVSVCPSFRPSVCHSVHPSVSPKRKSSHSHNFSPILPKFIQHVYTNEKFYNMQFHKKVAKIVAVATVFLFKL